MRETKTENLAGPEGPGNYEISVKTMFPTLIVYIFFAVRQVEEKVVRQKDSFTPNNSSHQAYASSATKELDDLMASLSDFKVSNVWIYIIIKILIINNNLYTKVFLQLNLN